jgi:hypothetical protein
MATVAHPHQPNRWPDVLLWISWACCGWFLVAVTLLYSGLSLPRFVDVAVVLSGATVLAGAVVALLYVALKIWLPVRWGWGVAAAATNAALLYLFYQAIP